MRRVLIFDYDGVIVDSFPVIISIYKRMADKYGWDSSEEGFNKLFDNNFFQSLRLQGLSDEQMATELEEFTKMAAKEQHKIQLFKGIVQMLEILSASNILVIITSNVSQMVNEILRKNEISCIQEVLGADTHMSKVNKIQQIKNQYPDAQIFYIGDTVGDIREGKASDVTTVAVTWGYHKREELIQENPDYMVDSPKELLALF
jgi:phosphoglycolate phosphatase